ncbi:hypothetical protein ACFV0O_06890 [Kitasatospora sp. NPDC059577]|uniref:hypothetical protein n=1 Tax=Kitasatospora sp. NPDC059577 TaxID=3346873 RepID=UPI003692DB33
MASLGEHGRPALVDLTDKPPTATNGTPDSYLRRQSRGHDGSDGPDVVDLFGLVRGGRLDFSRSVSGALPSAGAARTAGAPERKESSPIRLAPKP